MRGEDIVGEEIMEESNISIFARVITAVDCQPTFDGGILVNVVGQLQLDLDPPQSFTQAFVLKEQRGIYLCFNDIFRIVK